MENMNEGIYLIAGATGYSGKHIISELLKNNKTVRIIARSKEKTKRILSEEFAKLEKIVYCDAISSDLQEAFQPNENGQKVTHVISALGLNKITFFESAKQSDYLVNKKLIDLAKQNNINKFVFVSALAIEHPYNIVPLFLNIFVGNCMHWKLQLENYLKTSGLSYVIVRPGYLAGKGEYLEENICVGQGDTLFGHIHRCTLGKVVYSTIEKNLDNVTFEVVKDKGDKYIWNEYEKILKKDKENSVIEKNHIKAKRILLGLLMIGFSAAITYYSKYKK